jgi:hypothetical protein
MRMRLVGARRFDSVPLFLSCAHIRASKRVA